MKKSMSKEVKIGIAFIISIFVLYFGISFLKGINIFKPTNSYIVVFDDVTGLVQSSPVIMNGYQVGLVYSIEIDEKNPSQIITVINLNKGLKIPVGSLFSLDVPALGNASVILKANYAEHNYYTSEDTIRGTRGSGMLEALSNGMIPQVSAILPKIDSILIGLQMMVNSPAVAQSLVNTEATTRQLEASTRQLNILLTAMNKDVPAITSNLATMSGDMKGVTSQMKSMDLVSSYNSIDSTLKNVQMLTDKLKANDNSLGLLINDRQLYDSIRSTLNNASSLLKDVKDNPSRYINVKVF